MAGRPVLAPLRRITIHRIVEQEGGAQTRHLAELFGVSLLTVARDIKRLHDQGLVRRVRGGAVRGTAPPNGPVGPDWRLGLVERARGFVREDAVIALSAGSIAVLLARAAARVPGVTAVTYSPPVARAFQQVAGDDQALVLTGRGPIAARILRSMRVDVGFVEVDGVDVWGAQSRVAELNRAILAAAAEAVFLTVEPLTAPQRPFGDRPAPGPSTIIGRY